MSSKRAIPNKWIAVALVVAVIFAVYVGSFLVGELRKAHDLKAELAESEDTLTEVTAEKEEIIRMLSIKDTKYFRDMVEREKGMVKDGERIFIFGE